MHKELSLSYRSRSSILTGCALILLMVSACGRDFYHKHAPFLPHSKGYMRPWYSTYPEYPNSYGFKNLGTAITPSTLFLSDNLSDDGDIVAVALNGKVVLDNHRLHTPANAPPYPLIIQLNQGRNKIDILCRKDPDGSGCTLKAEISNTTAGQGISTVNDSYIPEGEFASLSVEYKPDNRSRAQNTI